jgi:hypothetical protein
MLISFIGSFEMNCDLFPALSQYILGEKKGFVGGGRVLVLQKKPEYYVTRFRPTYGVFFFEKVI